MLATKNRFAKMPNNPHTIRVLPAFCYFLSVSELFVNSVQEEGSNCQWPYHCLTDRVIFFSIRFLTQSTCDYTTVSQTSFFSFFLSNTFSTLNVSDHTTVSQNGFLKPRSVRPWYSHWHQGIKWLRKKTWSDRPLYGHWGLLNLYGHW